MASVHSPSSHSSTTTLFQTCYHCYEVFLAWCNWVLTALNSLIDTSFHSTQVPLPTELSAQDVPNTHSPTPSPVPSDVTYLQSHTSSEPHPALPVTSYSSEPHPALPVTSYVSSDDESLTKIKCWNLKCENLSLQKSLAQRTQEKDTCIEQYQTTREQYFALHAKYNSLKAKVQQRNTIISAVLESNTAL